MDQYAGSRGHSTVTQNLLHLFSASSIIACYLLDVIVQGKITEADALATDNPSGRHPMQTIGAPPPSSAPFLRRMPFLPQPSQFILAWDRQRIMLACIMSGLVAHMHSAA